jgi:putative peptidoglycan lipid II flippase
LSIAIPASVGLILLKGPLVQLIYERGAFSHEATVIVSDVLMYYAFGLFAYATTQIVVPAFLALQDPKTPMRVAIGTTALNFCLNLLLGVALGMAARGFALATAISATCNLVLLAALLRRRLGLIEGRPMLLSVGRITAAAVVMGAWVYAVYLLLDYVLPGAHWPAQAVRLLGAAGVGMVIYLVLLHVLGSREVREILRAYTRRDTE